MQTYRLVVFEEYALIKQRFIINVISHIETRRHSIKGTQQTQVVGFHVSYVRQGPASHFSTAGSSRHRLASVIYNAPHPICLTVRCPSEAHISGLHPHPFLYPRPRINSTRCRLCPITVMSILGTIKCAFSVIYMLGNVNSYRVFLGNRILGCIFLGNRVLRNDFLGIDWLRVLSVIRGLYQTIFVTNLMDTSA